MRPITKYALVTVTLFALAEVALVRLIVWSLGEVTPPLVRLMTTIRLAALGLAGVMLVICVAIVVGILIRPANTPK